MLDLSVSVLTRQSDCSRPISVDSPDDVFKNILSSITSIMTDRAAVMKPFVRKMQDYLESEHGGNVQLNFLHCMSIFYLVLVLLVIKLCLVQKDFLLILLVSL